MLSRYQVAAASTLLCVSAAAHAEWTNWRGPYQNGVSDATGLVESWSAEGENLIWRKDFIGRSTPVVMNGRVFVQGRGGDGPTRRELVAAFDAATGDQLWEVELSTALTTVPYNRAGWSSPVGDPETGHIYVQAIAGPLVCLDADGNVVWRRALYQELGRFSGYGGRTHTPTLDEDRLIVNVINGTWGNMGAPRHRYYAFDKRTGDVLWHSTPGGNVYDRNTTSNGIVAVVDGQRLFIAGNADGHIYALKARTGELVWGFELSKRGINSSPVMLDASTVLVGHSEENIDEATLGRTVAIDATGSGDVTKTHEKWRRDIKMGFPSPLVHGGVAYVMDNSANLIALSAESGETLWEHNLGTVGKAAPMWSEGKIYVTEVNGYFHILRASADGVEQLDRDNITMPDTGRYAEIYGSPAPSYGRIFFTTEEGLYSIGDKSRAIEITPAPTVDLGEEKAGGSSATILKVVPGDITLDAGESRDFRVMAFNETGREVDVPSDISWSLDGIEGSLQSSGRFSSESGSAPQAGEIVVKAGDLSASARVRTFPALPWADDFEDVQGRGRNFWIGAGRYQVSDLDGNKVLEKPPAERGLLRSKLLIGPDDLSNYTIQAEMRGGQVRRRKTDGGLINSGYELDLQGVGQKLQIRTWAAVLRMAKTIPFEWEMERWYVLKLRVDSDDDRALVRGKVWPKGEPEPEEWTITAEDPLPVRSGAPGIQAYSPASIYFDNVKVTVNQ